MGKNVDVIPKRVREDKYHVLNNMLHSIEKALSDNGISHEVRRSLVKILVGKILLGDNGNKRTFEDVHGHKPPFFLTISPTKRCNLRCLGCYASSSSAKADQLEYDIVNRIMDEKTRLWGSHFTVISGGEPFMWKSQGKDIIDLAREHGNNYFLMYTNGTLIDERMAERLSRVGNITPAVSVEGFEKETDARRGKGVHKKILRAFRCMRKAGVPFGISITATRQNAELVLSDEFIDTYFDELGAIYGWIFQYMPIGREYTLDLMVTPEQRKWMFKQEQHLVRDKKLFIADFWNSGAVSNGCISAGRPGGYFYIDWNGTVTPCVFFPYSVHNIKDVYREGGDLNTVLFSPFFESIRQWQREYSYMKPAAEVGNQIIPCVMRDHHCIAREIIEKYDAQPEDERSASALKNKGYYNGMLRYDKSVKKLADPVWEAEYIGPERMRQSQ
jgi:MoaA/NifB/PqqE/SkfB family radical SAM enzyme